MTNLMKALLKAQKEMGAATKGANNPFFRSKYADYGSVLEAVKEPLNNAGVLLLQPHIMIDGNLYVKTVLVHAETGEEYSSTTPVVCSKVNDPQALGSAITYARRYGLQSLPCLPVEDDDGNAASGKTAASVKTPTLTKLAETKKEEVATVSVNNSSKVLVQNVGLAVPVATLTAVKTENPVKKLTSWT